MSDQIEKALALGWRVFEQGFKKVAEKTIALPGYTSSILREEADSLDELAQKVNVRELLLGGDPSQPVADVIYPGDVRVTGAQHAANQIAGVAPVASDSAPQSDVVTAEAAEQPPADTGEEVNPLVEEPADANEASGVSVGAEPEEGATVEVVPGVEVEPGVEVSAPGVTATEPVPSTEEIQPEQVVVQDQSLVSDEAVLSTVETEVVPDPSQADVASESSSEPTSENADPSPEQTSSEASGTDSAGEVEVSAAAAPEGTDVPDEAAPVEGNETPAPEQAEAAPTAEATSEQVAVAVATPASEAAVDTAQV